MLEKPVTIKKIFFYLFRLKAKISSVIAVFLKKPHQKKSFFILLLLAIVLSVAVMAFKTTLVFKKRILTVTSNSKIIQKRSLTPIKSYTADTIVIKSRPEQGKWKEVDFYGYPGCQFASGCSINKYPTTDGWTTIYYSEAGWVSKNLISDSSYWHQGGFSCRENFFDSSEVSNIGMETDFSKTNKKTWLYRRTFEIPAARIVSASLKLFSDNKTVVYVNGNLVDINNETCYGINDLISHLNQGTNVLAIQLSNDDANQKDNPLGLAFQLNITTTPIVDCGIGLDLFFVQDDTGSMWDETQNVKSRLTSILNAVEDISGGDYRLGLMTFKDYVDLKEPLTERNIDSIRNKINLLTAIGGFGVPEASDIALRKAVNESNWRPAANKIIILNTDAPPGGLNDRENPEDYENGRLGAREAATKGIKIVSILSYTQELSEETKTLMKYYADTTGGLYLPQQNSSEDMAEKILAFLMICRPPVGTPTPTKIPTAIPTPPAVPITWNITAQPVCPSGMTPKPLRMFRIIWPEKDKGPESFNCASTNLSSGSQQMSITSLDYVNNIYVGLEVPQRNGQEVKCSEGISFKPISITPSSSSVIFAKYMNPYNWMAFWKRDSLAAGDYTIRFEIPPEYCEVPVSPTPTFTITPTPIPTGSATQCRLVNQWGTRPPGGLPSDPEGIAFTKDGNFLYLTDAGCECIKKYKVLTDGNLLYLKYFKDPNKRYQVQAHTAIATDTAGNLYITDPWSRAVYVLDSEGRLLKKWEPGIIIYPTDIVIDNQNNIYIKDETRVYKFNTDRYTGIYWNVSGYAWGISVDKNGNVYVAEPNKITRYTGQGQLIDSFGNNGELVAAKHLTVSPSGIVYVSEKKEQNQTTVYRISVFDANRHYLGTIGSFEGQRLFRPDGITTDSQGAFFIADLDERILKYQCPF